LHCIPTSPDGKGQTNDADASEKFVCPNLCVMDLQTRVCAAPCARSLSSNKKKTHVRRQLRGELCCRPDTLSSSLAVGMHTRYVVPKVRTPELWTLRFASKAPPQCHSLRWHYAEVLSWPGEPISLILHCMLQRCVHHVYIWSPSNIFNTSASRKVLSYSPSTK
jgi:hypothetical protein